MGRTLLVGLLTSGALFVACGSDDSNKSNEPAGAGGEPAESSAGQGGGSDSAEGGVGAAPEQPSGGAAGDDMGGAGAGAESQGGEGPLGLGGDGGEPAGGAGSEAGAGGSWACQYASDSVGTSLLNGSFELPALATPTYKVITPGNEPAGFGWTPELSADIVKVGWNTGIGTLTGPAQDGSQYLDLVSAGGDGHLRQTLDVTPGQTYQLKLAYSNNPASSPKQDSFSATVSVLDCDAPIFVETITHSDATFSDLKWVPYSKTFVAPDPVITIEIIETIGGGNAGILLDGISLTLVVDT